MRALVCSELSDDFSGVGISDVAAPTPQAGEVQIAIKAASLNFPDILMTEGKYQFKPPLPFISGMECSGVVSALGEGVTHWKIGDCVVGGNKLGAFAETICLPANRLHRKPDVMSHAEASAYGAAWLTAYVSLVRRARLLEGETLLVHGASGGVGLAAADVGRILGARVIVTSASQDKLDQVVAHTGAEGLLVTDGFREKVKEMTGGRGADVIFDPVGGDVFDESVRCIAFDGRLLVIGFTSGRIPTIGVNMPLIKGFSVVGVRAGEYGRQFPERGEENLAAIWTWAEQGKAKPRIHAEVPLSEWRDAFAMMQAREIVGKVVICP
ncbi:MAG: NADPH:quinone oxidoreductase family protein [Hyphomonas sp.]